MSVIVYDEDIVDLTHLFEAAMHSSSRRRARDEYLVEQ